MAKRKVSRPSLARSAEPLYREIRAVLESARAGAYRAVNTAMVQAYWHVGRLIVEHEQGGRKRAAYGEAVLDDLSQRLTADFGRGFTTTNLKYMRSFYVAFPIRHALRDESAAAEKVNALRSESDRTGKRNAVRSELAIHHPARGEAPAPAQRLPATLRPELSWTHYRLLLGVEHPEAREWYMREAADQHWSTRQLERQISVLYYERLLASRRKAPVRKEAAAKLASVEPEQFIRDPYVLEFLDLKDYPALRESAVEQAIIDNLQAFLLELGKGVSFVVRQRRLRFEDEDFYVDLVFYNYLLKGCARRSASRVRVRLLHGSPRQALPALAQGRRERNCAGSRSRQGLPRLRGGERSAAVTAANVGCDTASNSALERAAAHPPCCWLTDTQWARSPLTAGVAGKRD